MESFVTFASWHFYAKSHNFTYFFFVWNDDHARSSNLCRVESCSPSAKVRSKIEPNLRRIIKTLTLLLFSCSGNGACFPNSSISNRPFCFCSNDWTSVGDLRYQFGINCDVYVPVVIALYALILVLALILLFYNMWSFLLTLRRVPRIRLNILIHVIIFLADLSYIGLSLVRIIYPTERAIGLDGSCTFFFFLANCSLYLFGAILLYKFFQINLSQSKFRYTSKSEKSFLGIFRRILTFAAGTGIFSMGLINIAFFFPIQGDEIFMIGQGFAILALSIFVSIVPLGLNPLLNELKGNFNKDPIYSEVYLKFKKIKLQMILQSGSNVVVAVISLSWPAFRQKMAYIVILSIFGAISILFVGVKNLISSSVSTSSSAKKVKNESRENGTTSDANYEKKTSFFRTSYNNNSKSDQGGQLMVSSTGE